MPIKKLKVKTKARTKPVKLPELSAPIKQEVHHHYYPTKPKNFNFGKLSFGLFLVVIGVLYLAKNMGWLAIDFNFNLWQMWPLLIVFWGLSLLTGRNAASIFAGVVLTITVLTITLILVFGANNYDFNVKTSTSTNADRTINYKNIKQIYPINIKQDEAAKRADFIIKSVFSTATIGGGSTILASGQLESNSTKLVSASQMSGVKQVVTLETKPLKTPFEPKTSLLHIQLPDDLVSAIYLDSIASTVNFSLAKLSSHLVNIKAVASSLTLDLTEAASQTIDLSGQASQIILVLPANQAVKLNLTSPTEITSDKLEKINDLTYATPGYEQALDKISLTLDLTDSPLTIK